jgi:hypothetical protein
MARTILVASVAGAALLGGAPVHSAPQPAAPATARPTVNEAALVQRPEWPRLRAAWAAVGKLGHVSYESLEKSVEAKRSELRKLVEPLIAAKLVGRAAGEVLIQLHGDRVYHVLRKTAATCYDPTQLGARVESTREAREKQLALLAELARKGAVKPELVAKVRRTIEKQTELLLRVSSVWEQQRVAKSPNWPKIRKEEEAILALFARREKHDDMTIKDEITLRPGVEVAMRICQLLLR